MDKTIKLLYNNIKASGDIIKNFTFIIQSDESALREIVDDVILDIYGTLDVNIKFIGDKDKIVNISYGKFTSHSFANRRMTIPLLLNKDININLEEVYCKIRNMLTDKMLKNPKLAVAMASGIYSTLNVTVDIYPEPNRLEKLFIREEHHKIQRMYITELSVCP